MAGLLLSIALGGLPRSASAADVFWIGGSGNDWATANNWDTLSVPGGADNAFLGYGSASTTDVTSDASVTGLTVGGNADATLNISGGTTTLTTTGDTTIGENTGITGTVGLTGATWDVSGFYLYIGYDGSGELTLDSSASLNSYYSVIGYNGTGMATVTGAGSNWDLSSTLTVGRDGDGTLTISDGGAVTSGQPSIIGTLAGSSGTVTVTGTGSSWDSLTLIVGSHGDGTLTISDGGTATVGNTTTIGYSAGSSGIATVTGTGSSWDAGNWLYVGRSGTGTLTVSNGGDLTAKRIRVGEETGSTGTVTVDGTGSSWNTTYTFFVGNSGTGTVTVSGGGQVANARTVVGLSSGGTGTVTVDGTGSSWNMTKGFEVGTDGTGTVTVSSGGEVTSDYAQVGSNSGGVGNVTVTGSAAGTASSLAVSDYLTVGSSGNGTLTIAAGGTVSVGGTFTLAEMAGSTGTLNIGAAAGETAVAAGTLDAGSVVFGDGTGLIVFNHTDQNYTFADDISGAGAVEVYSGETVLTGTNTYTGGTTVHGGQLTVNGSITGDVDILGGTITVSNGGDVTSADTTLGENSGGTGTATVDRAGSTWTASNSLTIGSYGSGTLTIADGGTVSVGGVFTLAENIGSTGTLNIGAAAGETAVAAGTLDAGSVAFGDGAGLIVFNHTGENYEFGADISGAGAVEVYSGETVLTGTNTYTGGTTIYGGLLSVNGSISGDVILDGGALGGSGSLGNVTASSGATIAPGNSVGTLNVANATFSSGSSYDVELNDGGFVAGTNNDLLNASGTVTIASGVTVNITPENGTDDGYTYAEGTYTIVTAAGGVTGTFDTLTDDYLFLDFALGYDATNIYLTSTMVAVFADMARTGNQRAAAGAAQSLGPGNAVFDAILALSTDAEAQAAFDAISGEIHASAKTALIEDSRFVREASLNRLRNAFGTAGADRSATAEQRISETFSFWGESFGSWGSWDSDGNAASMDRDIGGFFLGGDAEVMDNIRAGLMGGYSRSSFSVDDRASSGTADTWTAGVYSGGRRGGFSWRNGAAYSWHVLDTNRTATFTGYSDSTSSNYDARTIQTFSEVAYGVEARQFRFEPFANMAYVNLQTDGFTETGGSSALTADRQTSDATFTTLGVRAESGVALGQMRGTLRGMAGYRHAFSDVPDTTLSFVSGGNPFTVAGVPIAEDTFVLEAGAGMALTPTATLGLSYGGQFGSGVTDQSLKARFNARF